MGAIMTSQTESESTGPSDLNDPWAMFHHLKLMEDVAEEAFMYRRRIEWLREFGVLSPEFPSLPEHHQLTLREWDRMRNFETVRLTAPG